MPNLHPSKVTNGIFPFALRTVHDPNTGHIYIRPVNNLIPFSAEQDTAITRVLAGQGIGVVRKFVKGDFTETPIDNGYGFRIFEQPVSDDPPQDDQLAGILLCDECVDMPAIFHAEPIIGDEERSNGSDLKERDLCETCLNDLLAGEDGHAYQWTPIEDEDESAGNAPPTS